MEKNYKVSSEISSLAKRSSEEAAIEALGKAGFDCWDFSLFNLITYDWNTKQLKKGPSRLNKWNYKRTVLKFKKIGEKYGMTCNQAHAPFPTNIKNMEKYIKRAIVCAHIAGAKVIVIHPDNNLNFKENAKIFRKYLAFARKYKIKIACENMWNWDHKNNHASPAACSHQDDFLKHIKEVNDPNLVACVDIGHASMIGLNTSPYEMIKTLGDNCQCLHIHDTDNRLDKHQIPFSLNVDFESMVKALKEIGYQGDLTLEADQYAGSRMDLSVDECAKNLYESINRIRNMLI